MSFNVSPTALPDAIEFLALTRDPEMAETLSRTGQPAVVVSNTGDAKTLSGVADLARTHFRSCVMVDVRDNELATALEPHGLRVVDRSDLAAVVWSRTLP